MGTVVRWDMLRSYRTFILGNATCPYYQYLGKPVVLYCVRGKCGIRTFMTCRI